MKVLIGLQRFGHFCYKNNIPVAPSVVTYVIRLVFGAYLPSEIDMPASTTLGYGALGVVIHKDSIIGERCHIGQHVTLGGNTNDALVPKLGNDVYLGAGAKIIGGVVVGDGARIGANAVVINDVPPRAVAVGVPARNILRE